MKEYGAYLFDADGTIMDTRELIYRSFIHMGEVLGVALPDRAGIEATIGLPVMRQMRDFLGPGRDPADYENAAKVYDDHMLEVYRDHLGTFPGVREGLRRLAGAGKKMAIVTSRRRRSLELFTSTLGIREFFSVLVTPDDTREHKPHPEPALLALKLLDAGAGEAVFVGDAEFDILCGNGAGTATAFVTWGGMDHRKWPVRPDFVAEKFEDLLPVESL